MTTPTDTLRAIVAVYERHEKRHGGLERSEQEANVGSIRDIITTKLKEAGG
jgi:hypothetical protein